MISESKGASLIMEIAKRAVLQSVETKDKASAFVSNLFREATNYYVSRDLPGHLGSICIKNVPALIAFKSELTNRIGHAVGKLKEVPKSQKEWAILVQRVTEELSK